MQIDPHLREFGFTCDILTYARQLPVVVKFVERFPDQPFFVDHITKPAIAAQPADFVRGRPEAEQPKIFGETAACYTV
jgi:predicted TIM-barrel fold metal-dependent hydrolase